MAIPHGLQEDIESVAEVLTVLIQEEMYYHNPLTISLPFQVKTKLGCKRCTCLTFLEIMQAR